MESSDEIKYFYEAEPTFLLLVKEVSLLDKTFQSLNCWIYGINEHLQKV
jgi:hypothetical protein